ncbi:MULTISPECIES: S28 family serine protease [unclassified Nocardia]|uniref:S28 family serine protease n=1 Tax=unclassified Nocardia TaxID=2637762 RepID=UPI001CE41EDB|nr:MULTISPECIES: S28 family serine protease [unclassified Nocardia]
MTTIDRYVRLLLAVFVLLVPCVAGCARDEDIRTVLQAIPGLRVKGEQPASGGRFFELTYRQPIDHDHPERGDFDQRLTLLYRATDRPMVLYTSGYDLTSNVAFRAEPTELVGSNQIVTEQRYFGSSRPAAPDWTTLDIRQAAADHHRLIAALRPIFRGAWISAGASKGGMASIYHRRFYPDDVVGTIAYSAPNILDDADPTAYDRFVAEVGTPECRAAIIAVQREILLRRKEIDDRLTDWARRSGYAFQTVGGVDRVVELVTLQVPMYFWMHRGVADCGAIPPAAATTETLYTWLDDLVQPASYTDQGLAVALPSFYQLGTQLGTARYSAPGLTDLLRYPNIQDMRNYVPRDIPLRFDPDAMADIDRWVRRDSTGLIFIYGANDPTRAKPFRLGPSPHGDAVYLAPAANHLARIANLTAADQAAVLAALTRWSHGSGSH